MAEDNAFATNEGFIPYREVLPPPWFPPDNYYDYPGVPYVQPPTQWAPGPWDRFDPFYNEQEEQRRKKGKEIVPNRRFRNPSVWNAQSEGHGVGAYGPLPHQPWPALPPWRPALAPSMQVRYPPGRPVKHVHHDYLGPEGERRQRPPIPEAEITISRNVDGILTPNSGDLTVHLTMDVEEDLENHLDEMSRLSRLGHFLPAKAYFDENLQHHIDNPYVLVQYADLLLRQGDLKGVTLLKTEAIDKLEDERPDSAESRILRVYFELIRVLAKSYTLDNLRGLSTVFEDAVDILNAIDPDKPISSTEVGIFALTNHLMYHPVLESNRNSNWFSYGLRLAMPITTTLLYQALLRQGRIWDLHDFFVLMPTLERIKTFTHDIFKKNLISSLQAMVSDWTNSIHGYDASTTLGLLSILTHMLVAPLGQTEQECTGILKICLPLALSVMENDPSSLKSRPYLRVLLANSRFAQAASSRAMESLTRQLQCSQGIYYQADIALLPVYVPLGNENPPWTPVDQPAELKDPIKLILRSAIELGDLETEVFARRELIRLSSDPREEYNKLCALQLSQQGDLNGYGLTLASSYLTSVTKTEKEDLAAAISRLLPKVSSTDFLDASHEWVLNMLLYKIEGKSSSTIRHMLERNDANHRNMEESLLREISRKMPQLENWAEQRLQSSASSHLRSYKNKAPNESRAPIRPALRTQERTKDVSLRRQRRVSMNEQGKDPDITLISSAKPHYVSPQVSRPVPEGSTTLVDPVAVGKQGPLGQAQTGANSEITEWVSPENRPIRAVPAALASQASKKHNDDALLERQIRDKLEAEFDKRLEAEKESERERRAERAAILEELKKEVVAIRKEAVEQAERKARVEARDRAEQLIWERQNEEIKLKKEVEMAKAAVAAAELEAKLEAARKIAVREAEKKQEEETEMRKIVSLLLPQWRNGCL
ncbi:hypothetical protein F4808DRAFT_449825 [Astrocystis sublimbata]|nr:hypothetical protein F4808DRAFT_449825 [Astrocystis sublimbata]